MADTKTGTARKLAPPLESVIVKQILAYLNGFGLTHAIKVHGSAFMAGQPDILCCAGGLTFFFEVKRPGGKATELQKAILAQWAAAGARVAVVTSVEEVGSIMEREAPWLAAGRKEGSK